MSDKTYHRRTILQGIALALPVSSALLRSSPLHAAELPQLAEDDPAAKALFYVHDGSEVDASNPATARYQPDQTCANCLQVQGEEGASWRPCAIFPGKSVNAAGWCSVWVAKP